MGRGIPAGQVLGEYVGNVMTEDEFRRGGSQKYGIDLPNPLEDVVIDAWMHEQGAAAKVPGGRVTCIMAKLNDTRIIRPRHEGTTASLPSNAEGNTQFVCADGPEANCSWVFAQCDGCKAHDAAVLVARGGGGGGGGGVSSGGGGGGGGGRNGCGGGGGGGTGGVVVGGGGGGDVKHHFHTLIATLRAISAAGEPLTLDYGSEYWSDKVNRMKEAEAASNVQVLAREKQELEVKLATMAAENRYLSRLVGAQTQAGRCTLTR